MSATMPMPAAWQPRPPLGPPVSLPSNETLPASAFYVVGSSAFRKVLVEHHRRVGALSRLVAKDMGLAAAHCDAVSNAGALHDIGKIFVPEAILQQPGPLDADEVIAVRQHSFWGYIVLRRSDDPVVQLAAIVALQHHECWDGTGYPFGLRGDQISLEARIVSVCDVYDALRSSRPYKPSQSHDVAVGTMLEGDDRVRMSMFDPAVLRSFERVQGQCRKIFEEQQAND